MLVVWESTKNDRCRGPERTPIGERPCDNNPNIERSAENGERDDDPCDGSVDRPHVLRQSIGEKEEDDLEYDGENFDERVELPLLQAVAFALALPATFDNRSGSVSELLVQPLLAQHRDPCGKKQHEIRVQKV